MDTYEQLEVPPGALPPPPPPNAPPPQEAGGPKEAPMMPPMAAKKPNEAAKPLRFGDDINLESDTPKKPLQPKPVSPANIKGAPGISPKNQKPMARPIAGKTPSKTPSGKSKSDRPVRNILRISIFVVIFFCILFFLFTIIGMLHLMGAVKFIPQLRPPKCT